MMFNYSVKNEVTRSSRSGDISRAFYCLMLFSVFWGYKMETLATSELN